MLEFRVRTFPRTRAIWFADRAVLPSRLGRLTSHELLYRQVKEKPLEEIEKNAKVSPFTTLLNDLRLSEERLWASIHKSTRQDIKFGATRLRHDSLWLDTDPDFRLYRFIEGFYSQKKLWVPSRSLYVRYMANGIVSCCLVNSEIKVLHFYLLDQEIGRARLLWSARALHQSGAGGDIARLNKMLHWEDLLYFRNKLKMVTFDWGGIALTDDSLKGVDDFKRRFGGTLVTEWDVAWRQRMYARIRRPVSRQRPAASYATPSTSSVSGIDPPGRG